MDKNNKDKAIRGKKLPKIELAYIAGLLDGEGCINIYRINTPYIRKVEKRLQPKWVLSVSIYNTHYETIKWLYDNFGGYLQSRHRYKKPEQIENGKWKPSYAWKLAANKANDFLKRIVKYLRIKKEQVELAIKFQDNLCQFHRTKKVNKLSGADIEFREKCWLQMKMLNQKGVSPAENKRKDTLIG